MSTIAIVKPAGPVEVVGHETTLTLTQVRGASQAVQQYTYDPQVIDEAVKLGDMKKMTPAMRLDFYRAVCLSVGLNPLTQPFTPLERQDKTVWLYANSVASQQLAALHQVSFSGITRRQETVLGEPLYIVEVSAALPNGRTLPSQAVVSLTKKKKVQKGTWPNSNDPRFVDALDADGEPILIPLRGEALANAMMKADTKSQRRAVLALVGLGWMLADAEGQRRALNLQTGAMEDPADAPRALGTPVEAGKTLTEHCQDLYNCDPVIDTTARVRPPMAEEGATLLSTPADLIPRIEAAVAGAGGNLETYWPWACRQRRKPTREALSVEDLAMLLQLTSAAAAQKQQTAAAQGQEPLQTEKDISADAPAPSTQPGASQTPQTTDWRSTLQAMAVATDGLLDGTQPGAFVQQVRDVTSKALAIVEDADATEAQGQLCMQELAALGTAWEAQQQERRP